MTAWQVRVGMGIALVASMSCARGGQFHPLPSQVDVLERERATVDTPHAPTLVTRDGDVEGKLNETLAALYALFERHEVLRAMVSAADARGADTASLSDAVSRFGADLRHHERVVDDVRLDLGPSAHIVDRYAGTTMLTDGLADCVDVYETPSTEFGALWCVTNGTPIYRCESQGREWMRGLVYRQGVVNEVYVRADELRELDPTRKVGGR